LPSSSCTPPSTEPVKLSEFCRDIAFATVATPESSRDAKLFYKVGTEIVSQVSAWATFV
jgi:hypothetical protein